MNRVSSTPLSAAKRCDRVAWFLQHHGLPTSYQMAFGTMFHAGAEFWFERGRWPALRDLMRMKGNYEDPSAAYNLFPKQWPRVQELFRYIDDELGGLEAVVRAERADVRTEVACDDWDMHTPGGVLLGGYIDGLVVDQQRLFDFKTRGSLDYAPSTPDEWRANIQLRYYATLVCRRFDWDHIRVEHINFTRPRRGRVCHSIEGHGWSRDELEGHWPDTLALIQRMADNHAKAVEDVEPNRAACFDYGPCKWMGMCPAGAPGQPKQTADNPFAGFGLILDD